MLMTKSWDSRKLVIPMSKKYSTLCSHLLEILLNIYSISNPEGKNLFQDMRFNEVLDSSKIPWAFLTTS